MYLVAVPAYGRDYKSKSEVIQAWQADKDFQLQPSGSYINRPQLKKGDRIEIRYGQLRKLHIIKGEA